MPSILQTCIPAYRLPVFDAVADELGEDFRVVAGDRFFDPSIRTVAQDRPWFRPCTNRFLAGNRLLWQEGGAVREMMSGPFIVEANPRCLRTWLLLAQAKMCGMPTAVWGHALGRGVRSMAASRKAMFSLADAIICYCYAEQESLQALFPGKRILVAGNSTVRASECLPLQTPAVDRHSVLFLGRLVAAKKPMLLLRAVRELQRDGAEIGVVLVGDGPERPDCKRFTREAGLTRVGFVGEQFSRERIRELAATCFAVASPGYVGLSVLDAQSMGLPVAFSHEEPNSPEVEILRENWNALAFAGDDPGALAAALLRLHKERVDWLARGGQFCEVLTQRYSIERMALQFVNFFRTTFTGGVAAC